ncbi:hypothetical protein BU23DRAFT_598204 [Bimuria novae-zelandiae CBS 107.79]|uniref:Uncharacterized protein n=1 Tax=Bimuria novae-zelandiae CBS 107.79 TaxID=1447943 RepID=A0A6A5VAK7_9PLEO|nr:hypothetical protein BU23DRAFT_598204 [Bimuria novae-zelandiae CBS 107.79]
MQSPTQSFDPTLSLAFYDPTSINQLCQGEPVPLMTIFTPPASCAHQFTPYSVDDVPTQSLIQKFIYDCVPPDKGECAYYFGLQYDHAQYPYGYTTWGSSLADEATVATCCSSKHPANSKPPHQSGFEWTELATADRVVRDPFPGYLLASAQCVSSFTDTQTKTLNFVVTATGWLTPEPGSPQTSKWCGDFPSTFTSETTPPPVLPSSTSDTGSPSSTDSATNISSSTASAASDGARSVGTKTRVRFGIAAVAILACPGTLWV